MGVQSRYSYQIPAIKTNTSSTKKRNNKISESNFDRKKPPIPSNKKKHLVLKKRSRRA